MNGNASNTNDPFDEFEFKPLTDGLGFHKKTVSLKEGLKNTGVLNEELQSVPLSMPKGLLDEAPKVGSKKHTFEDVLNALEKTPLGRQTANLQFTEPLPRPKDKRQAMEIETPRPVQSPFPRPEAYKNPALKKSPMPSATKEPAPTVGTRRGAADSPPRKLMLAPVSFESAFLDLIIVAAFSMVFLIALLMVTKVDLSIVIANLDKDIMTRIAFGVLFITVMQMYAVVSRSFFGRTIGEWTFDLQLGVDEEQRHEIYPLRVILRSLLNTVTGLILLPLISALIGRDVAGQLSGVKLYRQRA